MKKFLTAAFTICFGLAAAQENFLEQVRRAGGIGIIARSEEDARRVFE